MFRRNNKRSLLSNYWNPRHFYISYAEIKNNVSVSSDSETGSPLQRVKVYKSGNIKISFLSLLELNLISPRIESLFK